ncbi:MAG: transposase [Polyangiales bacterium]
MTLPRRVLPNRTYLITRRCLGRRFLLRPDRGLNNAFVYCLALAARKYDISVHALCAMSNHYHLVITDTHGVLPDFMAWLNRHLAMCVKRLRRWDEVVWEPNVAYSAVELVGASEVLDKVAYVLLNPVSAALVRSPERWPGAVSTLDVLRQGTLGTVHPGIWFKDDVPKNLSLPLSLPPCFSGVLEYHEALGALVRLRLTQARAELRRQGRSCLGRARVRKTAVSDQPATKKQRFGLNPTFSALTRDAWRSAVQRLRAFRLAYRVAYEAWRTGDRTVAFPAGTWWVVRYAGAAAAK